MAVEQMKFIQQVQHKKFFAANLFTGIAILQNLVYKNIKIY